MPSISSFFLCSGISLYRPGRRFQSTKCFLSCHKIGDWVCEFIWLPHTLQPVQYCSGASTPVSDFTLKSANLLSIIEHFLAFSTRSCIPHPAFALKTGKTCCPIPTASTCHHQCRAVIPGRRPLLTVSAYSFSKYPYKQHVPESHVSK